MTKTCLERPSLFLDAYLTSDARNIIIRPNLVRRQWIERETAGNGYRCVPLNMASTLGWSLVAPFTFAITFDGQALAFIAKDGRINPRHLVSDQFGGGIVTFAVSVLFRTPPGHNLLVTGPLNEPKRGAAPLTGLVETDWAEIGFTMNWKITEPNFPVVFEKGEPFCTFFPYPRHYVEQFEPALCELRDLPDVKARYDQWLEHRLNTQEPEGHYMRGEHFVDFGVGPFADHQRRMRLKEFRKKPHRAD